MTTHKKESSINCGVWAKGFFQKRHYLLDAHVPSWVRYPKENEALKNFFFICTSADIVAASFLKYYEI